MAGRIVGVHDGDTVTLLDPDKRRVKCRLAEIDAPELGQPYGAKAKQALSALVFKKDVIGQIIDVDRYGRAVVWFQIDGINVNRQMVRQGAAWAYRDYLTETALLDDEADAAVAGVGLWALQNDQIMPPWEWRRSQAKRRKETAR